MPTLGANNAMFTDIYLNIDDWSIDVFPDDSCISDELLSEIRAVLTDIDLSKHPEQTIEVSGIHFRMTIINSVGGTIVALRRIAAKRFSSPSEIGYPSLFDDIFGHPKFSKGGMILVAGTTGVGKSTLAASVLSHRLTLFSGFALTVEEPNENILHGKYGKGVCIQKKVPMDGIGEAVRQSLRSFPAFGQQIFYIGEVRDSETAYHALTSALNGQLVITTFHGADVIKTLERFVALSEKYSDDASSLLASSLRLVVHLREINRQRSTSFLFNNRAVSDAIQSKKFDQIKTSIDRQKIQIQMNKIPEDDIKSWG